MDRWIGRNRQNRIDKEEETEKKNARLILTAIKSNQFQSNRREWNYFKSNK